MKRFIIGSLLLCISCSNAKQIAPRDECDQQMSESECDQKIKRDLASAIRDNPKACSFEPTWRPTNIRDSTLHVSKADRAIVIVLIDGKSYALQPAYYRYSVCQGSAGRGCPRWNPEVGKDYPVTITNSPEYLNGCLERMLPARREMCIGFGKINYETHPYGTSRTPEFEDCYSLPAN